MFLAAIVGLSACSKAKDTSSSSPAKTLTIQTQSSKIQITLNDTYKNWQSKYKLPGWSGPRYKDVSPELAEGETFLILDRDRVGYSVSEEPAASEIQALKWLLSRADGLNHIVVGAIYEEYPKLKQSLLKHFNSNDLNSLFPTVNNLDDMRELIGLVRVYFLEERKNGLPYIVFDLDCNWDVEHGIQVLMNGDRVVRVGTDGLNPSYIKDDGGKI